MSSDNLDEWVAALASHLEIDPGEVDVDALLDVAREAAHSVTRPAAPVTTFLVGYAAGLRAAAGTDIGPECERASDLARAWQAT